MRHKYIFLTFVLTIIPLLGIAQQVNETQALKIAKSFYTNLKSNRTRVAEVDKLSLVYTATSAVNTRATEETPFFYVFGVDNNNGYIIVSADERVRPVLGYSTSGSFNIDDMPYAMRSFLLSYEEQIYAIRQANPLINETIAQEWTDLLQSSSSAATRSNEEIILNTAKWGQDAPYNKFGPKGSVTGCVATAMSIVMHYHQWPVKGIGSNSYLLNGETISANFEVNYNWKAMPIERPAGDYTSEQADAIAQLMFHAGVSVNADFGSATGAQGSYIAPALQRNFDYDKDMRTIYRSTTNETVWFNTIRNEINNNRPLIYSGNSSIGGHSFIADGYDNRKYLHINWGWDGQYNGFYAMDLLSPYDGVSFSNGEEMVVGIQKPGLPKPNYSIYTLSGIEGGKGMTIDTENVTKNTTFNVTVEHIYNPTNQSVSARVAIALTDKAGNIKEIMGKTTTTMNAKGRSSDTKFSCTIKEADILPTDLLYTIISTDNEATWQIVTGNNIISFLPVSGNVTNIPDDEHEDIFKDNELGFNAEGVLQLNAGKLSNLNLGNKEEIKNLTIIGTINADDFYFIRDNMPNLKRIDFSGANIRATTGNKANRVPGNAFFNSPNIEEVVLPNNVTELGEYAFSRTNLRTINLPNSIWKIDTDCFSHTQLEGTLRLPDNLEYINPAFYTFQHNELTAFDINSNNAHFATVDGVLYNKDLTNLISYPARKEAKKYQVDAKVTVIDGGAFSNISKTQVIDLSACKNLTSLYRSLFASAKLDTIIMPPNATDGIEYSAFMNATINYIKHISSTPTPMMFGDSDFLDADRENIKRIAQIVPVGTKSAYANAPGWKNFPMIYEEDEDIKPAISVRTEKYVTKDNVILGEVYFKNANGAPINNSFTIRTKNKNTGQVFEQQYGVPVEREGFHTSPFYMESIAKGETNIISIEIEADNEIKASTEFMVKHSAEDFKRNHVFEWVMGSWCGWSIRTIAFNELAIAEFGQHYIPIAIHMGDPMEYTEYREATRMDNSPSLALNRKGSINTNEYANIKSYFTGYGDSRLQSHVNIQLKAEFANDKKEQITVTTQTVFGYNSTTEDARLTFVLLENNVVSSDPLYDQNNFYAGGSSGPMHGYEDKPDKFTSAELPHQHVARYITGYNGIEGSIPTTVKKLEENVFTHTFNIPETVMNKDNLEVVAILIDNTSQGELINATTAKVNGVSTNIEKVTKQEEDSIILYPNPVRDILYFNTEAAINRIELFNSSGQIIIQYNQPAGSINISNLPVGLYFVRIILEDGSTLTRKIHKVAS